jgi:hypothetical protein
VLSGHWDAVGGLFRGHLCQHHENHVSKHIALLKETSQRDPLYKFLDPGLLANLYTPLVVGLTPSPGTARRRGDGGCRASGLVAVMPYYALHHVALRYRM